MHRLTRIAPIGIDEVEEPVNPLGAQQRVVFE
jgi:hypothetical protein